MKLELAMHDTVSQRGNVSYDQLGDEEKEQIEKQVNMFIDGTIPEIQVMVKICNNIMQGLFQDFAQEGEKI